MIRPIVILFLFSNIIHASCLETNKITKKEVLLIDEQSARIELDSTKNTVILYNQRNHKPHGFYLMVDNRPKRFVHVQESADSTEPFLELIDYAPAQIDIKSLFSFELTSFQEGTTLIKSYAVFSPLDFAADRSNQNNKNIHIFHFMKTDQTDSVSVMIGENKEIVSPKAKKILEEQAYHYINRVIANQTPEHQVRYYVHNQSNQNNRRTESQNSYSSALTCNENAFDDTYTVYEDSSASPTEQTTLESKYDDVHDEGIVVSDDNIPLLQNNFEEVFDDTDKVF